MQAIAKHCSHINMAKVYDIRKILLNCNDNSDEVAAIKMNGLIVLVKFIIARKKSKQGKTNF